MANVDLLIPKLDRKLRSLHEQQSLITKTGRTGLLVQPLLPEFIRLTTTDGIIPGIELMVVDALSHNFNLYEDDRERQQILAAQADELNDSKDSDILASIQIIQDIYPSIYSLTQDRLILTRDRAISKITGVMPAPMDRVATTTSQLIPLPVTQLTPPSAIVTPPQSKSILVIGLSITCAVLFGAVVSNSFNKSPNPSTPAASNNTQAPASSTPADSQATISPPVPAPSTPADSQANTSVPEEAPSPLPTPTSSISRDAAAEVVKQWMQYKKVLFAPPYDTSQGSNLLTGKAYINNVDRSSEPCNNSDGEGCLSSVDWLKKYNGQYSFGVQRLDSIDRFEASGDSASVFVTITEYRTLYKSGRSTPSGGTKQARYDLKYEDGRVKISDYKVF
jgi:ARC6-like, IMS domain